MFDSLGLVLGRINQIQQLTSQFQQVEQPATAGGAVSGQPSAPAPVADDRKTSSGAAAAGGHRVNTQGSFADAFAAASEDTTAKAPTHSSSAAASSRSTSHARAAAASASAAAASHTMTAPATASSGSAAKAAAKPASKVGAAAGGFTPVTASSDTVGTAAPGTSYPALADLISAGSATPPGIVAFDSATNQYYVTVGSQNSGGTVVPQGAAASLSGPSSDTYALLQQLYAYQNNPGLLDQMVSSGAVSSPSALPKCFTDPTERAWTIVQLAADVVTSGPAYYGQYAGLSNAQIIQAYDLYTKNPQLNLNPVLAGALTRAYNVAKQDPTGGSSAPLTDDQINSAHGTITVVDAGIMGQVVESHLP